MCTFKSFLYSIVLQLDDFDPVGLSFESIVIANDSLNRSNSWRVNIVKSKFVPESITFFVGVSFSSAYFLYSKILCLSVKIVSD